MLKRHIEKLKTRRVEPAIEEETKSSDENDQYYSSRKSLQQGTDSLTPIIQGPYHDRSQLFNDNQSACQYIQH